VKNQQTRVLQQWILTYHVIQLEAADISDGVKTCHWRKNIVIAGLERPALPDYLLPFLSTESYFIFVMHMYRDRTYMFLHFALIL
jgi:hypothetical protein